MEREIPITVQHTTKTRNASGGKSPESNIANAHQENGKTDGVPPFLKTAPNAQNDSAKQHIPTAKAISAAEAWAGVPLKYDIQMRGKSVLIGI